MTIIISPHLDDAVLSLGQHLATLDDVTVITVFAGIPKGSRLTAYDAQCGFTSSREAVEHRQAEDIRALETVGAKAVHWPFHDRQYGQHSDRKLTEALRDTISAEWPTYVPVGIGHPDHEQVARCALEACPNGFGLRLYEELPYRVLNPEQVVAALDRARSARFNIGDLPYPLALGPRAVKREAIREYRSQFPNGAEDPCLLVPERVWQVERCHGSTSEQADNAPTDGSPSTVPATST